MTARATGKIERFAYAVDAGRLVYAAFLFSDGREVAAGRRSGTASSNEFVLAGHEHITEVAWSRAADGTALGGVRVRTTRRACDSHSLDARTPALAAARAPAGCVLVDVALRATPDGTAVAALEPVWGPAPGSPSASSAAASSAASSASSASASPAPVPVVEESRVVVAVRQLLDRDAVRALHAFAASQNTDAAALARACAALQAAGDRLRTASPAECPPAARDALAARYSVLRVLVLANIDLLRTEHPQQAQPQPQPQPQPQQSPQQQGVSIGVVQGPPLTPLTPAESAALCAVPFFLVPVLDPRLALSVTGAFVHLAPCMDDDDDDDDDEGNKDTEGSEKNEEKEGEDTRAWQRWVFTPEGEVVLADGTQPPQWRLVVRARWPDTAEVALERRDAARAPAAPPSTARWLLRGDRQTLSARLELPPPPPRLSEAAGTATAAAGTAAAGTAVTQAPPMTEVERYYAAQERQRRTVWCLQAGPVLPGGDCRSVLVDHSTGDVSQQWLLKL